MSTERIGSVAENESAPWFRRVTLFSVVAGLCPLIPVPFLDDKVLGWVRRRMIREVLSSRQLQPSESQVRILSGEEESRSLRGCMAATIIWPVIKLAVYLVKKVIKKIILILTFKECVDRFSETLHEGYLVHRAAGRWEQGAQEGPREVRGAIEEACQQVDPRLVHQVAKKIFRGSRWLLVRASRALAKLAQKGKLEQVTGESLEGDPDLDLGSEESLLRSLTDSLSSSLWTQQAYWQILEEHFERALTGRLAREEAPQ